MIDKPNNCAVCGKPLRWNLFWELDKWWLRHTEISLLWENCCSSKCYERLLETLLDGSVKLRESKDNPTTANAWIKCSCGQKHRLIPAIDAPVYWCGNNLLKLKAGDEVEYEEPK